GPGALRWSGETGDLDGIEIVNLDAAARESLGRWPASLLALSWGGARALAAASGPELEARRLWDRMLERRLVLATGGSDAHGRLAGYCSALATVANVVLLAE